MAASHRQAGFTSSHAYTAPGPGRRGPTVQQQHPLLRHSPFPWAFPPRAWQAARGRKRGGDLAGAQLRVSLKACPVFCGSEQGRPERPALRVFPRQRRRSVPANNKTTRPSLDPRASPCVTHSCGAPECHGRGPSTYAQTYMRMRTHAHMQHLHVQAHTRALCPSHFLPPQPPYAFSPHTSKRKNGGRTARSTCTILMKVRMSMDIHRFWAQQLEH